MRRKREKKSRFSIESKGNMGDYLSTQKEHFQAAPQGKPRHCTLPPTTWWGGRMTMARATGRENDDGASDGEEVLGRGAVPLAVGWCDGGRDVPWLWS
jgi:hypothetical protein